MTTPTEDQTIEATSSPLAAPVPSAQPRRYRFGKAVFIALMVGPALVLLASLVFTILDILGHPHAG